MTERSEIVTVPLSDPDKHPVMLGVRHNPIHDRWDAVCEAGNFATEAEAMAYVEAIKAFLEGRAAATFQAAMTSGHVKHFDCEDIRHYLCEIAEKTTLILSPQCQAKPEYDYIIAHQDDPAFIDKIMAALDDFDPTTYWPHNIPGHVDIRPYRPATCIDIYTALAIHLDEVAVEVATDLLLAEGVRTPLAVVRRKMTKH